MKFLEDTAETHHQLFDLPSNDPGNHGVPEFMDESQRYPGQKKNNRSELSGLVVGNDLKQGGFKWLAQRRVVNGQEL